MKARKRFAQHFLEPAWVHKVVAAARVQPTDAVVEIGPGRAAITRPLSAAAGRVLAIEIDRDLASALEARKPSNVTVVCGRCPRPRSAGRDRRMARRADGTRRARARSSATFPTTSRRRSCSGCWTSRRRRMASAMPLLMIQKEVADRLVARAGTSDYGVLTVLTALHADVTRVLSLPPGAFRPAPKVHSAVVRLAFRPPQVAVAGRDGLRADGPEHVHPAAKDPAQRPEGVCRGSRDPGRYGPRRRRH